MLTHVPISPKIQVKRQLSTMSMTITRERLNVFAKGVKVVDHIHLQTSHGLSMMCLTQRHSTLLNSTRRPVTTGTDTCSVVAHCGDACSNQENGVYISITVLSAQSTNANRATKCLKLL